MKRMSNPYQAPNLPAADGIESKGPMQAWFRPGQRLPEMCAVCAAPAVSRRGLAIRGRIQELLAAFGNRNSMGEDESYVVLPVCQKHRNFRKWWPHSAVALLVAIFVLLMITAAVLPQRPAASALAFLLTVLLSLVLAWHVTGALRIFRAKTSGRAMLVSGLAPEFVKAVDQLSQAESSRVGGEVAQHLQQIDSVNAPSADEPGFDVSTIQTRRR